MFQHTFIAPDFGYFSHWKKAYKGSACFVRFKVLPTTGELTFDGRPVAVDQVIDANEIFAGRLRWQGDVDAVSIDFVQAVKHTGKPKIEGPTWTVTLGFAEGLKPSIAFTCADPAYAGTVDEFNAIIAKCYEPDAT